MNVLLSATRKTIKVQYQYINISLKFVYLWSLILFFLFNLSVYALEKDDEVRELEIQLDKLLLKYTENHPDVIMLRKAIAELQSQQKIQVKSSSKYGEVLREAQKVEDNEVIVMWDFREGTHNWQGNHRIDTFRSTDEGLELWAGRDDPWIEGPKHDFPSYTPIQVTIRMKSTADTNGQLFYGRQFSAKRSYPFSVIPDGKWHDYSLILPPLGNRARLRLDPSSAAGRVTIAWIRVESASIGPPRHEVPQRPQQGEKPLATLASGDLLLTHYGKHWGGFVVQAAGMEMAAGHSSGYLGYLVNDEPVWLPLEDALINITVQKTSFSVEGQLKDSGGGSWRIHRTFALGKVAGSIEVEVEIETTHDRQLIHFPWLTLFPGLGTFGQQKHQGLFAGVEYLADEPSSSEADVHAPRNKRLIPDPTKITFPLMALSYNERFVGVIWETSSSAAAVFDSPDRVLDSGAHLFAFFAPGVGQLREENELYTRTPLTLRAGVPLKFNATIIAGRGPSVISTVQFWPKLKGWPEVPKFGRGFQEAITLLAHGWLESEAHHDGQWRHAVRGNKWEFKPAADAVTFIHWLANHTTDTALKLRLLRAVERGLSQIPPDDPFTSTVSHIRQPVAPLVYGRVIEYVRHKVAHAKQLLENFDEQGIRHFRPESQRRNLGSTHFATHANGLAASELRIILRAAALSGDRDLLKRGLGLLDKLAELYAYTVPRGAQTWEIPLHTPDILASAYLTESFVLGYELTGRQEYLDQALYWAWTGVPFIYLTAPTSGQIGPYATIPVLGATKWRGHLWIGLPVQWCGLVYASALHRLSKHDPSGPWETIAKGVTSVGLQMTWGLNDRRRQGLLPDWFQLQRQRRDGPAINPGTVQAHIPELFNAGKIYEFLRLKGPGWLVHAPGRIQTSSHRASDKIAEFVVNGWSEAPYIILIAAVETKPAFVGVYPFNDNDRHNPVNISAYAPAAFDYFEKEKLLVIYEGRKSVSILIQ